MRFIIQTGVDSAELTVQVPGSVTRAQRWALQQNDGVFFGGGDRGQRWLVKDAPQGFTMTRTLTGPYAAGTAVRWCQMTGPDFGYALALFEGVTTHNSQPLSEDNAPEYPVEYAFNDRTGLDVVGLQAAYEAMPNQVLELGTMRLTTQALRITDPCYDADIEEGTVVQALPGIWKARLVVGPTSWHTRVKQLQVTHESLGDRGLLDYKSMANLGIWAGVDSGKCGFFDDTTYPEEAAAFEEEADSLHERCCSLTLDTSAGGGVLADASGVVSQSGFGDGAYPVYGQRDANDRMVALTLVFIEEGPGSVPLEAWEG